MGSCSFDTTLRHFLGLEFGENWSHRPWARHRCASLRDQPALHVRCPLHLTEIFPDWFLCPIGAKRAGGLVWCASLLPAGVGARMRKSTHPCVSSVAELLGGPGSLLAESWVLSSFPFSSFPQSDLVICSACLTLLVSSSQSSGCFTKISGRGLPSVKGHLTHTSCPSYLSAFSPVAKTKFLRFWESPRSFHVSPSQGSYATFRDSKMFSPCCLSLLHV